MSNHYCSGVRLLLIELHVSTRLQMRKSNELRTFAEHVFREHGFRTYRHRTNLGKMSDRFRVLPELVTAGLHPEPCCYELHLMREPLVALQPTTKPWRLMKRRLPGEPSLADLIEADNKAVALYDRKHNSHNAQRLRKMRKQAGVNPYDG